ARYQVRGRNLSRFRAAAHGTSRVMDTDTQRSERLYAHPIQIVRTEDGAMARRGIVRLHVRGKNAADILIEIAKAASRPNGSARSEIEACFDLELRPAIGDLIDAMLTRRLLVTLEQGANDFLARTTTEEREDVFFWTFGTDRDEIERGVSARRIAIVGVN